MGCGSRYPTGAMARDLRSWLRWGLVVLACVLGVLLRLRGLASQPLFGDEYHTILAADEGYGTILTTFDGVGSHVALPLLQRLSLDLFGEGVLPFRLVAVIPGLLTLLLAAPLLAPVVGGEAAALATLALALSPMHVYYSRFGRAYALLVLLALVLGTALHHVLTAQNPRRVGWIGVTLGAGLLPWVHLSSAGFVAALGLVGLALALRRSRGTAVRVTVAFGAALVMVVLLYLPLIGQVREYFRVMVPEGGPLGWFGIPTLVAGDRVAAVLWLVLLPLAVPVLKRTHGPGLALAGAALLGPLVFLLSTRPRGMDYAWARYLLTGLPFVLGLVAAAFLASARALPERVRWLALPAGALLLGGQFLTGPLAGGGTGPFDNTYLAMHRLEAFDEPWPDAPEIYATLAADPRVQHVVEAPVILTRAALLYRSYARLHGKRVSIGWVGERPRAVRGAPYVDLLELERGDADWVVLHRDPAEEMRGYFSFVYEQVWPRIARTADESFMRRQEAVYAASLDSPERTAAMAGRLFTNLGPADVKDGRILAWNLETE
jgi:hypothetical protein